MSRIYRGEDRIIWENKTFRYPDVTSLSLWMLASFFGLWAFVIIFMIWFTGPFAGFGMYIGVYGGAAPALASCFPVGKWLNSNVRLPQTIRGEIYFDERYLYFNQDKHHIDLLLPIEYGRSAQVEQRSSLIRDNFSDKEMQVWFWEAKARRIIISRNYADIDWNQELTNAVRAEIIRRQKAIEEDELSRVKAKESVLSEPISSTLRKSPPIKPVHDADEDGYL